MGKLVWLAIFGAVLVWSGIEPADRLTWMLEVFPAVIGFAVIAYLILNRQEESAAAHLARDA